MEPPADSAPASGEAHAAAEAVDATRRTRLANERTYLAWWRTGLASLVTAACFFVTIFFVPIIGVVAQSVGKAGLHPAIAPALIMIGYLMMRLVADISSS